MAWLFDHPHDDVHVGGSSLLFEMLDHGAWYRLAVQLGKTPLVLDPVETRTGCFGKAENLDVACSGPIAPLKRLGDVGRCVAIAGDHLGGGHTYGCQLGCFDVKPSVW